MLSAVEHASVISGRNAACNLITFGLFIGTSSSSNVGRGGLHAEHVKTLRSAHTPFISLTHPSHSPSSPPVHIQVHFLSVANLLPSLEQSNKILNTHSSLHTHTQTRSIHPHNLGNVKRTLTKMTVLAFIHLHSRYTLLQKNNNTRTHTLFLITKQNPLFFYQYSCLHDPINNLNVQQTTITYLLELILSGYLKKYNTAHI